MFEKKSKWGFAKYAITFIAGAAAGAAVALLYAPMTGKKMQKQVKDVLDDQVENVEKLYKKVVNA